MPNSYRTCSVEGCEAKHYGLGYCNKHYSRFKNKGNTDDRVFNFSCSVKGCEGKHKARGYCSKHSTRFYKHGDPLKCTRDVGGGIKLIRHVVENPPQNCVVWPYAKNEFGHGRTSYLGKDINAHRLSLIFYSGEDPENLNALHGRCHNPGCINPLHLRWGTQAENNLDKVLDGTSNRGEAHPMSKLTSKDIWVVRDRLKTETADAIAKSFGIGAATVKDIKHGRTWGWLK